MKKFSASQFREAVRSGQKQPAGIVQLSNIDDQSVLSGGRKIRFVFSDGTVDRQGDKIDPEGWNLDEFKKNPVALFSHQADSLPVGRASDVAVKDGKLVGTIEFADGTISPMADTVFRMIKGGFMRGCSVGFIPNKFEWSKEPSRLNGINFLKQTLLEISVVAIPANANSLAQAALKGIDTKPFREFAEQARSARMAEAQQIKRAAISAIVGGIVR